MTFGPYSFQMHTILHCIKISQKDTERIQSKLNTETEEM